MPESFPPGVSVGRIVALGVFLGVWLAILADNVLRWLGWIHGCV
jgi:hypothetical protein